MNTTYKGVDSATMRILMSFPWAVIVGTWEQHATKVLELIRRFGIDAQLVFNRAALMVLPSGINKAVGIRTRWMS